MVGAFQRTAFQSNAFQVDGAVSQPPGQGAGGVITGGSFSRKRWRELLEELRAEAEASAEVVAKAKRGQKAKAAKAAREAERLAEAAVAEQLLDEASARQLAALVASAQLATQTRQAMAFAAQVRAAIEALRERDEDEEMIVLMLL